MKFIDEQTGVVSLSWANLLRGKFPNTSFPKKIDYDNLSSMGIKIVKNAVREYGVEYVERDPQLIDGVWTEVLEAK